MAAEECYKRGRDQNVKWGLRDGINGVLDVVGCLEKVPRSVIHGMFM